MIVIEHRGNFNNLEKYLNKSRKENILEILCRYGQIGVAALSENTPVNTGLTSNSWGYEVKMTNGLYTIAWTNTNESRGVPIAIILQYGHGTRNGGYVMGRDYINPTMRPIFDKMIDDVWKEVADL